MTTQSGDVKVADPNKKDENSDDKTQKSLFTLSSIREEKKGTKKSDTPSSGSGESDKKSEPSTPTNEKKESGSPAAEKKPAEKKSDDGEKVRRRPSEKKLDRPSMDDMKKSPSSGNNKKSSTPDSRDKKLSSGPNSTSTRERGVKKDKRLSVGSDKKTSSSNSKSEREVEKPKLDKREGSCEKVRKSSSKDKTPPLAPPPPIDHMKQEESEAEAYLAVQPLQRKMSTTDTGKLVIDKKKNAQTKMMQLDLTPQRPVIGGTNEPLPPNVASLTVPNRIRFWACQEVRKGIKGIIQEHKAIISKPPSKPYSYAGFHANKKKNKYPGIKCVDESRVNLKDMPDGYIHANFVDGTYPKAYIATQGLLAGTRNDFWAMIWQENVSVVVMLCSYVEENSIQSFPCYNAEINKTTSFGKFGVTTSHIEVKSNEKQRYTRAELSVANGKETRRVIHLTHMSWGPKRPPSEGFPITLFLDRVHSEQRRTAERMKADPKTQPIVVQCNDGVGRTGTLIAIDVAWKTLVVTGMISIKGFVERIREQRAHCLRETRDYMFVYLTLFDNLVRGNYIQGPEMEFFRNALAAEIVKL